MNLANAKLLAGGAGRGIWRNAETLLRAMLTGSDSADGVIFTSQFKIGTSTGTGTSNFINLGFVPDMVLAVNVTDRDEVFIWSDFQTTLTATRIGTNAGGTTTVAGITAGVAEYNDTTTGAMGFSMGATMMENGKTLAYIALRNKPTT
jgi:hypothetical protein